jgi:hypothetical protein
MENQFATLTKSYYDNFLEYKLTGNESNQKAYMSAEQGIQSILNGLNDEVNAQSNSIASFYQSDVQGKLKSIRSDIQATQRNIITNKDRLSAAEMRIPTAPVSDQSIPNSYLMITGALLIIGALLSAM